MEPWRAVSCPQGERMYFQYGTSIVQERQKRACTGPGHHWRPAPAGATHQPRSADCLRRDADKRQVPAGAPAEVTEAAIEAV